MTAGHAALAAAGLAVIIMVAFAQGFVRGLVRSWRKHHRAGGGS
jgi:hypothetical protein